MIDQRDHEALFDPYSTPQVSIFHPSLGTESPGPIRFTDQVDTDSTATQSRRSFNLANYEGFDPFDRTLEEGVFFQFAQSLEQSEPQSGQPPQASRGLDISVGNDQRLRSLQDPDVYTGDAAYKLTTRHIELVDRPTRSNFTSFSTRIPSHDNSYSAR